MTENQSTNDVPARLHEKLVSEGAAALSDAELLAILLKTRTIEENTLRLAERVLTEFGGLHGLSQTPLETLSAVKGLGEAKSVRIAAGLEISKRLTKFNPQQRPIINRAQDAALLVSDMQDLQQEQVRIILLNSVRQVTGIHTVYVGTLNASVIRIAELFREAVINNCPALIIVHNHPSGTATPSPEDIELTHTVIAAGQLLDITVLDHIIISQGAYTSIKEMGLAFT